MVGEEPAHPFVQTGLRGARPGEHLVRHAAAQRGDAPGTRLQPLRVRQLRHVVGHAPQVAHDELRARPGTERRVRLDDLVAERPEPLRGLPHGLLALRLHRRLAQRRPERQRDPQPARVGVGRVAVQPARVVVLGDHVEHRGRVGDPAAERADAGQPVPVLLGAHVDQPARGLQAEDPAEHRRDADRATAVGTRCGADDPRRDRRRRPAGRTARGVVEVPRVAGRAVGERLRERPQAPVRRPRVPDQHAPAARNRATAGASASAGSNCGRPPRPVTSPATSRSSFTASGTPSSGVRSPAASRRCACAAAARAWSAQTIRKAFRRVSTARSGAAPPRAGRAR